MRGVAIHHRDHPGGDPFLERHRRQPEVGAERGPKHAARRDAQRPAPVARRQQRPGPGQQHAVEGEDVVGQHQRRCGQGDRQDGAPGAAGRAAGLQRQEKPRQHGPDPAFGQTSARKNVGQMIRRKKINQRRRQRPPAKVRSAERGARRIQCRQSAISFSALRAPHSALQGQRIHHRPGKPEREVKTPARGGAVIEPEDEMQDCRRVVAQRGVEGEERPPLAKTDLGKPRRVKRPLRFPEAAKLAHPSRRMEALVACPQVKMQRRRHQRRHRQRQQAEG